LTRRGPKAIADCLAAEHPRDFVDAAGLVEAADRRPRPSAIHTLVDCEVRIGVGGDLRQVRDAEDLERGAERTQLAADDVGDAAADAGVDLVEDQTRRRRARLTI